jgi:hypothetical protein
MFSKAVSWRRAYDLCLSWLWHFMALKGQAWSHPTRANGLLCMFPFLSSCLCFIWSWLILRVSYSLILSNGQGLRVFIFLVPMALWTEIGNTMSLASQQSFDLTWSWRLRNRFHPLGTMSVTLNMFQQRDCMPLPLLPERWPLTSWSDMVVLDIMKHAFV